MMIKKESMDPRQSQPPGAGRPVPVRPGLPLMHSTRQSVGSRLTLGLVALLIGVCASAKVDPSSVRPQHSTSWVRGQRCDGTGELSRGVTLHVSLRIEPSRLARLERRFAEVSDPSHERFREFLPGCADSTARHP